MIRITYEELHRRAIKSSIKLMSLKCKINVCIYTNTIGPRENGYMRRTIYRLHTH